MLGLKKYPHHFFPSDKLLQLQSFNKTAAPAALRLSTKNLEPSTGCSQFYTERNVPDPKVE